MFHRLHLISLLCIYDTQMYIALIGETKHISIIALQWSRIVSLLMVEEKCMS